MNTTYSVSLECKQSHSRGTVTQVVKRCAADAMRYFNPHLEKDNDGADEIMRTKEHQRQQPV